MLCYVTFPGLPWGQTLGSLQMLCRQKFPILSVPLAQAQIYEQPARAVISRAITVFLSEGLCWSWLLVPLTGGRAPSQLSRARDRVWQPLPRMGLTLHFKEAWPSGHHPWPFLSSWPFSSAACTPTVCCLGFSSNPFTDDEATAQRVTVLFTTAHSTRCTVFPGSHLRTPRTGALPLPPPASSFSPCVLTFPFPSLFQFFLQKSLTPPAFPVLIIIPALKKRQKRVMTCFRAFPISQAVS